MASKFLNPSFFIIGERKCGTSSMYRYLLDHPDILPCKLKEPQFMSKSLWHRIRHFRKYQALFPPKGSTEDLVMNWYVLGDSGRVEVEEVRYTRGRPGREITGEASANTFHSVPPARVKKYFPQARAILMVRNPVERAWSHYRMFLRFAGEGRRLSFQLTNFTEDARREIENYRKGKRTYFVGPGVYMDRLPQWNAVFGKDLAVICSEDIEVEARQAKIMKELTDLIGVAGHDFSTIMSKRFNVAAEEHMDEESREMLNDFYAPADEALAEYLNRQLPWA